MPIPNHLGDYTCRRFEEGVAIQTSAWGLPGIEKEQGGRRWQTHTDGVGMDLVAA